MTQWLNRLRDELRDREPGEERLDDLGAADLLVLDDLGAQKNTAWALEKVYQVVNQRYEGLQPLVVTTNLESEPTGVRCGLPHLRPAAGGLCASGGEG